MRLHRKDRADFWYFWPLKMQFLQPYKYMIIILYLYGFGLLINPILLLLNSSGRLPGYVETSLFQETILCHDLEQGADSLKGIPSS